MLEKLNQLKRQNPMMLIVQLNLLVMRTMLALRLSGYGRETKRPAIGYGQRPENSQRADG
jgi:hypothetical protein